MLYKDEVCNLVYMHDISRMMKDRELAAIKIGSEPSERSREAVLGVKSQYVLDY